MIYLGVSLLLAACNKGAGALEAGPKKAATSDAIVIEPPASPTAQDKDKETLSQLPPERKLIKEGILNFETDDLTSTRKRISAAIQKQKGYIASESENKYEESLSRTLVVRIPVRQFDNFIDEVSKGVERFDNKDIQAKDVTEQFVDIQARLKTKKEVEQRYVDLLKKAGKISEILEIEQQIGSLREEIEATEGRLRLLDNQSVYSTVTLTYYKTVPPHQTAVGGKLADGFINGWNNLVSFVIGLVNIWPFILLIIAVIYAFRRWWPKKIKKTEDISS